MILLVKKRIRGAICHALYQYAEANSKYIKSYNKNNESSCLKYWGLNNLCGWTRSQKLPLGAFKWVEETSQFNEHFKTSCNGDSDEGYFIEADVQYPENVHDLHNDFSFLPERMKIAKDEKLAANLHDKKEYVIST